MIIDTVHLCYDPAHRPFSSDGAVKIQNLDSEKPASKMIRAVLRADRLDASSWEDYSLHRCYCKSKGKGTQEEVDDLVDPTLTLDELGIGEGHWLFIRKKSGTDKVKEDSPSVPASSRKRKRDQDVDDSLSSILSVASNSRGIGSSASMPKKAADAQASNLEDLTFNAAQVATSITKLLGGDQWKTQSIGQIGTIKSRSHDSLRPLLRLVKTSLEIPQVSEQDPGLFNLNLVEALNRAYNQRIDSSVVKKGQTNFFRLGLSDYEKANELLRGKVNHDGSWDRRSTTSHLERAAFSLANSGLSGHSLNTARAVCTYWNNDKWISQGPLPDLSPISLNKPATSVILRRIAELTRVKPGEATPDGFPPIVLKALRDSIEKNKEAFDSNNRSSKGGWAQKPNLNDALALLKKRVATSIPSSIAGRSSGASGSRLDEERQVRRRLDDGR